MVLDEPTTASGDTALPLYAPQTGGLSADSETAPGVVAVNAADSGAVAATAVAVDAPTVDAAAMGAMPANHALVVEPCADPVVVMSQGKDATLRDAAPAGEPGAKAPAYTYVAPEFDPSVAAPKKGGAGYLACKRVFDIVFSAGVCVLVAIPVAIASAAIAIESPGNPFFRQERVGQGGKPIRIFKLRSMVSDAHTNPQKYMTPEQYAVWKREQKLEDDPRVTKVGRILRRTSLDELPQFLNVLTGDLSVIGPRPVTLEETYEFGNARDEVLSCKPGITGWWGVTDRNNATWENGSRQDRELFYVRHQSFGLDARIFVKTFRAMAKGR